MYTEIKEAVAFLFRCYRHNSPRRRVALLMMNFANMLVAKCMETWDINDPTKDENKRMTDFVKKENGEIDKLFYTAAEEMFYLEVIDKTPEIKLFINPGLVYYKFNKDPSQNIIWSGDVNADDNYNPMPQKSIPSRHHKGRDMLETVHLASDAKNINLPEVGDQHPLILTLVDSHPMVDPSPIGLVHKKFEFHSKDHKPVNVSHFAKTRFGSNKNRPDHENMRRLQFAAAGLLDLGIGVQRNDFPFVA